MAQPVQLMVQSRDKKRARPLHTLAVVATEARKTFVALRAAGVPPLGPEFPILLGLSLAGKVMFRHVFKAPGRFQSGILTTTEPAPQLPPPGAEEETPAPSVELNLPSAPSPEAKTRATGRKRTRNPGDGQ